MNFYINYQGLSQAIFGAIREVRNALFTAPLPEALYHYTSAHSVIEIAKTRSFWATCIDDQCDKTEISHGTRLVTELASELCSGGTSGFAADVLKRLPFFMEERKKWIYIACSCDDEHSSLHYEQYGNYRLTFPASEHKRTYLILDDLHSDCWYQSVIYDEYLQRESLGRTLRSAVQVIDAYTSGQNQGSWAPAIRDDCARNVAQEILSMVVGLKRKSYEGEREWRIVCAPRLGSYSGAPSLIDENFKWNVKPSPRRHLELHIKQRRFLGHPSLMPPVPFVNVARNPSYMNKSEIEDINEALRANNCSNLVIA